MPTIAKNRTRTHRLTACAVMAAVICILGPISVPIGQIPISLGTLGIYLAVAMLGWKLGAMSTLIYLMLGLVGVPVLAGFVGGAGYLFGPTGGYMVGYIPMAMVSGAVVDASIRRFSGRGKKLEALSAALGFLGMILGTAVLYTFGTAWYCIQSGSNLQTALAFCVIPFIPFDIIKMLAAVILCAPVRRRLEQANLL